MGGSGFTQTYRELDAAANRLSRLLRSAGLEGGDAGLGRNHTRVVGAGGCQAKGREEAPHLAKPAGCQVFAPVFRHIKEDLLASCSLGLENQGQGRGNNCQYCLD